MAEQRLDDFSDVSQWLPVASGLAKLDVTRQPGPGGSALRLDWDFAGGGGFVVARRELRLTLPETWALRLDVRGTGPHNRLEIKLADPSGENVWWYKIEAFALPDDWTPLVIRSRELEFAWGPQGGGAMTEVGAIEIALAAGPGGKGVLSIAELRLEDRTVRVPPVVRASSAAAGRDASQLFAAAPAHGWRSASDAPQTLDVDFTAEREYGGLVVHWTDGGRASAFAAEVSEDGTQWRTAHATGHADAATSWIPMPGTSARFLRLRLAASVAGDGFGIERIEVRPFEFSRSIDTFFRAVAADRPRGEHPRYLTGEQSYWTPVGVSGAESCALMNQEGLVEADRGTFSLEPFLHVDGALVTWADAEIAQELADGFLPIPSSVWHARGLELRTTASATRVGEHPVLFVRYRVVNEGDGPRTVRLFAACVPFQVTPPWQSFGELGGMRRIRTIAATTHGLTVDGERTVIALDAADAAGAATFDQGEIATHLRAGDVPPRAQVEDGFGYASAALRFDLELPARGAREVHLAIPFGTIASGAPATLAAGTRGDAAFEAARDEWRALLAGVTISLPGARQDHVNALRSAIAHVLVERDGPALQPGPRRYTRSWIRDGAIMATALLRVGRIAEAQDFVRWYAPYQKDDGNVPCCVDRSGPDWLVEHDSHGQLVYAIAECFRFGGDRAFLDAHWPHVERACAYIETLRRERLDATYDRPEKRAFRGLLPESASHEGYLAHPVHSYWDDFWAVRALGDAAFLASARGDDAQARAYLARRDAMRGDVRASLATTIATRGIAYVPGSVEWADFDPTATSNAISLLGETALLPEPQLHATYAQYLDGFRRRRDGAMPWKNYTAYEVRIVGALVQLGMRDAANELADFLLADRRPPAWGQWPEITWRDPLSPGHIGDVPHAWIAAEWALAFRCMLAWERMDDEALVLAQGVPLAWLDDGVVVDALATYWGTLAYTLRRAADGAIEIELRGDATPPGGFVLRPPL
ncbi:discoidin domain-containing protein, partial [Candidatus Binatia bacterium]|nr:discoidin domain-containing protein [Candidatus Binatia bacterium]